MRQRGIIYWVRGQIAAILGIESGDAASGKWWEIDLIIVVLLGAFALGVAAMISL